MTHRPIHCSGVKCSACRTTCNRQPLDYTHYQRGSSGWQRPYSAKRSLICSTCRLLHPQYRGSGKELRSDHCQKYQHQRNTLGLPSNLYHTNYVHTDGANRGPHIPDRLIESIRYSVTPTLTLWTYEHWMYLRCDCLVPQLSDRSVPKTHYSWRDHRVAHGLLINLAETQLIIFKAVGKRIPDDFHLMLDNCSISTQTTVN